MIAGLQGVLPGMEVVGSESCVREADALPQRGLCFTLVGAFDVRFHGIR